MEWLSGSELGKEYVKAVHCHPAYLTNRQKTSCKMPGWIKHKLESRLLGEIITADDTTPHFLWQKAKKNKEPLDEHEESEKVGFKLNIQKTKITTAGPITSWQTDGEMMKTVRDFILGGSNITADGDYSHEIKRCLHFRRKAMTELDSILKCRDVTLPTKFHLVKAVVFPVVMYGCESWTGRKLSTEELMLLNCSAGEDS